MFRPQTVICRVIGFTSCSVFFTCCRVQVAMCMPGCSWAILKYFGCLSHQLLNSSGSGFMGLKLAPQSADGSFSLVVSALVTGKFATWPSWNDFVMFHPKDPKGMDSSRCIIIPEVWICFVASFFSQSQRVLSCYAYSCETQDEHQKKKTGQAVFESTTVIFVGSILISSYFWDQLAGHVCVWV